LHAVIRCASSIIRTRGIWAPEIVQRARSRLGERASPAEQQLRALLQLVHQRSTS
jgi:hypothetical protein